MNSLLKQTPHHTALYWKHDKKKNIIIRNMYSRTYKLNKIAGKIFLLCNGKNTIKVMIDTINNENPGVPGYVIQSHIITLLKSLERDKCMIINWDPF